MAGLVIRYRLAGRIRFRAFEWTPEARQLEREVDRIKGMPGFEEVLDYLDYDLVRTCGGLDTANAVWGAGGTGPGPSVRPLRGPSGIQGVLRGRYAGL